MGRRPYLRRQYERQYHHHPRPQPASINEAAVLGPRLEDRQQERGLLPNLVAIDFAGWGDAVKLVDQLNGVG